MTDFDYGEHEFIIYNLYSQHTCFIFFASRIRVRNNKRHYCRNNKTQPKELNYNL